MPRTQSNTLTYAVLELEGVRYAIVRERVLQRLCRRCGMETIAPAGPEPQSPADFSDIEHLDGEGLARRLIARRKNAGLTQAELARRAGIRIETLNRIERGRTMPDFPTVRKLVVAIKETEDRLGP